MSQHASQRAEPAPWVLIAGGFHRGGGMDKANAALASYLCANGVPLHLVSHTVDPELVSNPAVKVYRARKPAGSFLLGEMQLDRLGRAIAQKVIEDFAGTRVLVNGTNCVWSDINWVHCVHHSWKTCDRDAPAWFRIKNSFDKALARRTEAGILKGAKLLFANSERTRRGLIDALGVPADRVHTVYLGADTEWKTITPKSRAAARAWVGTSPDQPLVAFVGALGYDMNKGFDTLWTAWQRLCALSDWDANLVVAGGGRALPVWQKTIDRAGLTGRVRMLGFTDRIIDVLATSDLLVSPVRYESYGLNVHEAICCGVPSLVTASAGVAERYPADLGDLLLPDPEDADDLVARMLRWRSNVEGTKKRVQPMAQRLRAHTWEDMAKQIVTLVDRSVAPANAL